MLTWLGKFIICAIAICVVVYVCKLLLAQVALPEPIGTLVLLLIGVGVLIFIVRYLGAPPSGPTGDV